MQLCEESPICSVNVHSGSPTGRKTPKTSEVNHPAGAEMCPKSVDQSINPTARTPLVHSLGRQQLPFAKMPSLWGYRQVLVLTREHRAPRTAVRARASSVCLLHGGRKWIISKANVSISYSASCWRVIADNCAAAADRALHTCSDGAADRVRGQPLQQRLRRKAGLLPARDSQAGTRDGHQASLSVLRPARQ